MAVFIAIGAAVVAVALTAIFLRPKSKKPDSATDLEAPVAESGKPIPVVFGEITVKGLNVLHYGDKWKDSYKTSAGGKK